jgi:hypothetical protein
MLCNAQDMSDRSLSELISVTPLQRCSSHVGGQSARHWRFPDPPAALLVESSGSSEASVTQEQELTEPALLCTSDGRELDRRALGWSRQPLVTANLRGGWGRNKRWDYWAVVSPWFAASVTYADVDYLGIADVWWADLRSGASGGRTVAVPGARGVDLPDEPGSEPLRYVSSALEIELVDDAAGTDLRARWRERDGRAGELDVRVELPQGHDALHVVIPWSERRFQYTAKHQARPARGTVRVGEATHDVGAVDDAWGTLDVGRGRWPYRTRWNWAGGAGRSDDGRVVGLQFGGRWTEGTGFTENGLLVDGRLHKLGDELQWDYDWAHPMRPWRVSDPVGGRVDLVLAPRFDKHSRTEALVLGTEVHQVFGTWRGRVVTDEGDELELRQAPGFAEESRSRW